MQHWGDVLSPEHKRMLPRVHGLNPVARGQSAPEHVPPPADGAMPWEHRRPTAMTARRGQVGYQPMRSHAVSILKRGPAEQPTPLLQILVLCSTCLHSAWQNEDTVARKAMCVPTLKQYIAI